MSQTFIYDYVVEMRRQGVDAYVLTTSRENEADRPYDRVHVIPPPPRWHPGRIILKARAVGRPTQRNCADYVRGLMRRALESELPRLEPTIVHVHFGTAGVHALPAVRRLGVPLVVTFYGFDLSSRARSRWWRDRYRELWSEAAAVVVLCETMKAEAVQLGCPSDKVAIIRLAKDLARYPYSPPTRPVRQFISVGRLVEKKGHLDVLRAMRHFNDRASGLKLTLVGDGPLRQTLASAIHDWDLHDRVQLVGPASHDATIQHMRAADAFVLASKTAANGDREGTPTVLLEAQALGLPCVATHHSGIPEQIPLQSHWLLAEEGDVEGIAQRMRRLSECSLAQLNVIARDGRKKIEREFELSMEAGRLRELYDQLVR